MVALIERPRGKKGKYVVRVYSAAAGKKLYAGSYLTLTEAKKAEREKAAEFATAKSPSSDLTINAYAEEWLEAHHGAGTRRPAAGTHRHNKQMLRAFLAEFGDKRLDGIQRQVALAWARKHQASSKVAAAMFADAIDDGLCSVNPLANRRQPQSRERKHIAPLTETEVNTLADIAYEHWGPDGYGPTARAWVLFGAWVGSRSGETFRVTAADLDHDAGEVRVRRTKRRGGEHPVDTVVLPAVVSEAIKQMPVQLHGPIFRTRTGAYIQKGALSWYWGPIRSAFRQTVTPERWEALLDGQPSLAFYTLRHFAASVIVARGGNEYDVAAQLGNSPEVARATYVHSYKDERNARNRRFLDGSPPVVAILADHPKDHKGLQAS